MIRVTVNDRPAKTDTSRLSWVEITEWQEWSADRTMMRTATRRHPSQVWRRRLRGAIHRRLLRLGDQLSQIIDPMDRSDWEPLHSEDRAA